MNEGRIKVSEEESITASQTHIDVVGEIIRCVDPSKVSEYESRVKRVKHLMVMGEITVGDILKIATDLIGQERFDQEIEKIETMFCVHCEHRTDCPKRVRGG